MNINAVASRRNEILYTGTSLLGMNPQGIYTPAPIQTDLAERNFFQKLAITEEETWALGFGFNRAGLLCIWDSGNPWWVTILYLYSLDS